MALLDERIGFYAGESVEPFLQQIKKLFLEGNTDREIAKIIKQPRGTVAKAINSMKNGSAPVKISATELNNRPTPAGSNLAKSQNVTNRINETYRELTQKLGKPPTRAQLAAAANVSPGTIRSNAPNLTFTSAADEGAKATAEMYKNLKVNKPTRTTYEGVKGAKFKNAAQEKRYKEFLEKAAKFPKGSPNNPFDKKFFAKEFNMPETDVESIHKVIREKYNINYPKATSTSAGIRAAQLREKSDTGLEQEYTKLKKGERIGNPDLAHRVSKKYNVTTSNLGLDNPLINRVIIKPNERDISRLYDKRIKIENKYKLKDGTFKKPSNEDIKILEKINNDVETLARETKGRLSAVINDPTDLNKPYGSLGVDASKTIGGGIIDVDLKDVRKLSLEDQAFLKLNLLELKEKELNKTPKMLVDEFEDILSKPDVQKRIKNIIDKGNMEKTYLNQAKQILALSTVPNLTTADQLPRPEKALKTEMFKTAFKKYDHHDPSSYLTDKNQYDNFLKEEIKETKTFGKAADQIKDLDIPKGTLLKASAKGILRAVSPFIPFVGAVGVGLGLSDAAKAAERGLENEELGIAYLLGPELAQKYSDLKDRGFSFDKTVDYDDTSA